MKNEVMFGSRSTVLLTLIFEILSSASTLNESDRLERGPMFGYLKSTRRIILNFPTPSDSTILLKFEVKKRFEPEKSNKTLKGEIKEGLDKLEDPILTRRINQKSLKLIRPIVSSKVLIRNIKSTDYDESDNNDDYSYYDSNKSYTDYYDAEDEDEKSSHKKPGVKKKVRFNLAAAETKSSAPDRPNAISAVPAKTVIAELESDNESVLSGDSSKENSQVKIKKTDSKKGAAGCPSSDSTGCDENFDSDDWLQSEKFVKSHPLNEKDLDVVTLDDSVEPERKDLDDSEDSVEGDYGPDDFFTTITSGVKKKCWKTGTILPPKTEEVTELTDVTEGTEVTDLDQCNVPVVIKFLSIPEMSHLPKKYHIVYECAPKIVDDTSGNSGDKEPEYSKTDGSDETFQVQKSDQLVNFLTKSKKGRSIKRTKKHNEGNARMHEPDAIDYTNISKRTKRSDKLGSLTAIKTRKKRAQLGKLNKSTKAVLNSRDNARTASKTRHKHKKLIHQAG